MSNTNVFVWTQLRFRVLHGQPIPNIFLNVFQENNWVFWVWLFQVVTIIFLYKPCF